jgi:hypothetical protein
LPQFGKVLLRWRAVVAHPKSPESDRLKRPEAAPGIGAR